MEANVYRESARRIWIHLAVGAAMTAVPIPFRLEGLFLVLFIAGLLVTASALVAAARKAGGLSEYVRVSDESVDYVNPLSRGSSLSLPLADVSAAKFEKKKFGLTGRSSEMCAIIELSTGRKLTLTERFLPSGILEALVKDVCARIDARALKGAPDDSAASAPGAAGGSDSAGGEGASEKRQ